MLTSNPSSFEIKFPRRVSFDLSHNKIHVLPTLEQCRDAAKQRSREEWQRKTLNEDMLSDDIIIEIQEDCYTSSRESEEESEPSITVKSCLKKPPVVLVTTVEKKNKKSGHKKNQKKRKRSHSKSQQAQGIVSVH